MGKIIDKGFMPSGHQYLRQGTYLVGVRKWRPSTEDANAAAGNTGHVFWGGSDPVMDFVLPLPQIGKDATHWITQSDLAMAQRAAQKVLDMLVEQDSVGWVRPFQAIEDSEANDLHFALNRELFEDEMVELVTKCADAGLSVFIDASDPQNLKIIDHDWDGTSGGNAHGPESFHKELMGIFERALSEEVVVAMTRLHVQSGVITNRSSVPDTVTIAARQKIQDLNQEFRDRYGWGTADPNDHGTEGKR